jgi:hypothetical protein
MFVDRAIHQELPVRGPSRADVLDVEPDIRSAIAQELVTVLPGRQRKSFTAVSARRRVSDRSGARVSPHMIISNYREKTAQDPDLMARSDRLRC